MNVIDLPQIQESTWRTTHTNLGTDQQDNQEGNTTTQMYSQ